jgi:hypothetical protein
LTIPDGEPREAEAVAGGQSSALGTQHSALDVVALTIIVLVLTVLFADVIFLGKSFYSRDASRSVFPARVVVREILRTGEFPFWNPYFAAGQPASSNPSYALFYPPVWLSLIGTARFGFNLHYLFHFYLAAIGMYLLLRSFRLAPPASLFGALSLAMSGWLMGSTDLVPNFFTATWWPLILLFVRRLFARPNRRDFAIAAILAAVQAVIGEPVALIETWLLIAICAAITCYHSERRDTSTSDSLPAEGMRSAPKAILLYFLLGIAAAVMASVQIVPALDLLGASGRSRGFSYELSTLWSMPVQRPLELLLPDFFGTMQNNGDFFWSQALYPGRGFPYILSIYSGIAVLVLAAGGMLARMRGAPVALGVILTSYLLAIGNHTPLLHVLYATRVLRLIRYPEKFILIGLFTMLVFASFVLQECLDGRTGVWKFVAGTAIGCAVITGTFATLTQMTSLSLWHLRTPAAVELARQRSWIGFGMTLALLGLLFMLRDRRTDAWLAMPLLVAFVFIDLGWRSWEVAPRINASFYTPPPLPLDLIAHKSEFRLFHQAQWFRDVPVAQRYLGPGTLRYWVFRNGLFPMTPASWGFRSTIDPDFDGSQLRASGDFTDAMWRIRNAGRHDWAETLLPMANIAWRVAYRPYDEAMRAARGRARDLIPVTILRVDALPRYYFADQLALARDESEFVTAMSGARFSRRVAFTAMAPFPPAPCRVVKWSETPNSAAIDADCPGRGYLVASITPHKYWRATIDGTPAALHATNLAFQGMVVEGGRHHIVMRYSNPLTIAFGIVSLLALTICIGVAMRGG